MSLTKEQAEKLQNANLTNIAKKAKAGKTLTMSELKWIENNTEDDSSTDFEDLSDVKIKQKEWAEIYGVSVRAFQGWLKDPTFPSPFSPAKVLDWVCAKKNVPKNLNSLPKVSRLLEDKVGRNLDALETEIDNAEGGAVDSLSKVKLEKLAAERDVIRHKLEVMRGEVIAKSDHMAIVAEVAELFFATQEQLDEDRAEAWEGKSAVQIMQGRKDERDNIRNEIANILEA